MGVIKETIRWHWECLVHKFWVARYMAGLTVEIWRGLDIPLWLANKTYGPQITVRLQDRPWYRRLGVRALLSFGLFMLAVIHDASKHRWREAKWFIRENHRLRGLTYGSPEYSAALERIRPGIEEHYMNNPHHPEHYENGVADMHMFYTLEMVCDWLAATRKHADGNIYRSLYVNRKRFGYGEEEHRYYRTVVNRLLSRRETKALRAKYKDFLRVQPRDEVEKYALPDEIGRKRRNLCLLVAVDGKGEPFGVYAADNQPLLPLLRRQDAAEKTKTHNKPPHRLKVYCLTEVFTDDL